jgi:hypothetical protein
MYMPVTPAYGVNGGNGIFGADGAWIILLLLLGWGNNGGFGGGNGGGLYPWMNQADITNSGFQNAQLASQLSGIQSSISGISNQLCNSFAAVESGANARQMANMQQMFGLQSQFSDCCCENRLATANLASTIANDGAATRQAIANGIQSIKDQICQDKIDAKNDEIAQLRQEILYARGQASQIAQNQQIVDSIYNRLDTCPVGTTPVYGRTPIFSCNGNGCGCNGNVFMN